jgi:P pilus assembly chaperone PapD
MSGSSTKRIPVFVSPEELKFVEKDQSSHKQVLTVYNPYDFNINFEGKDDVTVSVSHDLSLPLVFSNAPKRYAVVEPKGHVKAQCCVDMYVISVPNL